MFLLQEIILLKQIWENNNNKMENENSRLLPTGQRSLFTRGLIKGKFNWYDNSIHQSIDLSLHAIFCRARFFYCDILNRLWMLELCLRLVPLWSHLQHFLGCIFSPFWIDGQRHFIMEWDLTVPKMGLPKSRKLPKFLLPLFYKLICT